MKFNDFQTTITTRTIDIAKTVYSGNNRLDMGRLHRPLKRDNHGADMSECIHCDIHDLLEPSLQNPNANLAEIATKVTEVLADLILMATPEDRTTLMADVVATLGHFVLEKSGEEVSEKQPPTSRGRH